MTPSRALSIAWCLCALVCCGVAVPIKISQKQSVGPEQSFGDSFSWSDCGQGNTEASLNKVTVTPEPVKAGQDFTLVFDADIAVSTVQSATFKTQVYLMGVPVYSQTDNLCDLNPCPMSKGRSTVKFTTLLPSMAPPGWYSLHIEGVDQDGAAAMCADIAFTIYPW